MKIDVLDTNACYRTMLRQPENKRDAYFIRQMLDPFAPLFAMTQLPMSPKALGCLALSGRDEEALQMLDRLSRADVWTSAGTACARTGKACRDAGLQVPDSLKLGILLGDPEQQSLNGGYTGIGSLPGFILIIVAPDAANLAKIPACVAHECHHNIPFNNLTWHFMDVTLRQYLAIEGLADSLATSLYGADSLGTWVTGASGEDLALARDVIGAHLDTAGFMAVRPYMYGDHPMIQSDKVTGIPYCGGYAVGFHAVQAWLNVSGQTAAEATRAFIDGADIVGQSGYFGSG
ncbi:MAG: DUF2268 domain-containing putative Zn-dependent protease [Clostridiales bacterium]|nr:DUF2268 domain-containing putative Zn-dependent protease [Clostridiales bacterium]